MNRFAPQSKADKILDDFFNPRARAHSFKECYVQITGDRNITGRMDHVDRVSLREALDSSSWADALGNSITRRMQAVFAGMTDLQDWRKVAKVASIKDFRTQERVSYGGYGNLPAVGQSAAYAALTSPGDNKATYNATKRGGLESITREMIANDDVYAIRRIPEELALAAANTLYEFVFDFFLTNPTIHDGVALYHVSRNNLFTAPLSAVSYAAHRAAMAHQPRADSGKPLRATPASLLVSADLEEVAYNLFVRGTNQDKTFGQSNRPEIIRVDYWTDATDFVTVADPALLPVIEVGFVNGQELPELFVQDMPNVGSMFSNDKLTYKIRHEYGGCVLVDGQKATTKAVVAG